MEEIRCLDTCLLIAASGEKRQKTDKTRATRKRGARQNVPNEVKRIPKGRRRG